MKSHKAQRPLYKDETCILTYESLDPDVISLFLKWMMEWIKLYSVNLESAQIYSRTKITWTLSVAYSALTNTYCRRDLDNIAL
ncbi:hypothetical protein NDU88_005938 [Pleurodeles waltl]|uniref:Uncharacterized protein n=1 Tax=Pleurodeles waltl TaxID=8319 RepID=A0AAV7TC31_PLEWA|nr:hypothetical protein NDU88_005938 [Pleurodeles waltl]